MSSDIEMTTRLHRAPEPRLVLAEHSAVREQLNGAWWPRSADISVELGPLLRLVTTQVRIVLGVALNRDEWPGAPLVLDTMVSGRVKVSWYGLTEPNMTILRLDRQRKLALLVIPHDTDENVAAAAMELAGRPGNDLSTAEVLARAHAAPLVARPSTD